ncbi:MAG TPA: hypothetical protein VF843_02970 [Streptosporangiaceae bacterium]
MRRTGRARILYLTALIAAFAVAAAGCGSRRTGPQPAAGHPKVVGYLPIPYRVSAGADIGAARVIHVVVRPGQRFAVKVATSDGPFAWRQIGRPPDRRVVRVLGDVNIGHCAAGAVGCRVPYFHVLAASRAGTTTMTWLYRELACSPQRKKMTQATRSCTATVTFDITVR